MPAGYFIFYVLKYYITKKKSDLLKGNGIMCKYFLQMVCNPKIDLFNNYLVTFVLCTILRQFLQGYLFKWLRGLPVNEHLFSVI